MTETEQSVTATIAERIKTGSKEYARRDPFKIGLVIEGGSMRGVISGGMVTALQALNAIHCFDAKYLASAGACAGAYFRAEQAPMGTTIYYQNINNRRFIDPARILIGKPIVDIPFLTYKVMKDEKPLAWQKIVDSPSPFHIYVTNAKKATVVDISKFSSQSDVLDALHWTCRMPFFAGMPVKVAEGIYYTDGGVLTGGIAMDGAIADGCTHLLILLTRPEGVMGKKRSKLEKVISFMLKDYYPELAGALDKGVSKYAENLDRIKRAEENPSSYPYRIESIRVPSYNKEISRVEKDEKTLYRGAVEGYQAVLNKFGQHNLPIHGEIQIRH